MATSAMKQAVLVPLVIVGALFSANIAAQTLSVEGTGTVEIEPEYALMTPRSATPLILRVMRRQWLIA